MNDLQSKRDQIDARVSITPVAVSDFGAPDDADPAIVDLEAELRVHGEVEVLVEERGEVELHAGNTEFDYQAEVIRVDDRKNVYQLPMERVAFVDSHYDV